jgi:hypothetical protein
MDPSVAKERVDAVLNKEEILLNDLYGYGKPRQPSPADGSYFVPGRLPDVADEGIAYGVPRSLLTDFKEVSRTLGKYVEDERGRLSTLTKWLKENNYTFEQYKSHKMLPGTKKTVYDLVYEVPENSELFKTSQQSQHAYSTAKDSYNKKYFDLKKTKNMGEIIKPGSMDLKVLGGRRSRRFRRRVRKTLRRRRS